jgi:hypothetical protein
MHMYVIDDVNRRSMGGHREVKDPSKLNNNAAVSYTVLPNQPFHSLFIVHSYKFVVWCVWVAWACLCGWVGGGVYI